MDQILIIDDDVALCELVTEYLEPLGFQIESVHRGDAGAERALAGKHSLVVLDVMLPGLNGFEVLRRIRADSKIPVLMLTARGDDVDRIVGLEVVELGRERIRRTVRAERQHVGTRRIDRDTFPVVRARPW